MQDLLENPARADYDLRMDTLERLLVDISNGTPNVAALAKAFKLPQRVVQKASNRVFFGFRVFFYKRSV